jgi:hypothetical protein
MIWKWEYSSTPPTEIRPHPTDDDAMNADQMAIAVAYQGTNLRARPGDASGVYFVLTDVTSGLPSVAASLPVIRDRTRIAHGHRVGVVRAESAFAPGAVHRLRR